MIERYDELLRRIEALEKSSHPPIDFAPWFERIVTHEHPPILPPLGELSIARLDLQPGDVLIVKIHRPSLSSTQAINCHAMAKNFVPPSVKVMVIDDGADLSIMTAKEIAERTGGDNAA